MQHQLDASGARSDSQCVRKTWSHATGRGGGGLEAPAAPSRAACCRCSFSSTSANASESGVVRDSTVPGSRRREPLQRRRQTWKAQTLNQQAVRPQPRLIKCDSSACVLGGDYLTLCSTGSLVMLSSCARCWRCWRGTLVQTVRMRRSWLTSVVCMIAKNTILKQGGR